MNYHSLAMRYFSTVDADAHTDAHLCDYVQHLWESDEPAQLYTVEELWFLRDCFINRYSQPA